MLNGRTDVFGGAVWDATPKVHIRVPSSAEAQQTVLKALLETPLKDHRRNPLDWVFSIVVHAVVLVALVIAPLFFTHVIDLHGLQLTYLVTPMPPAAPSPPLPAAAMQKLAPRKLVPLVPSKLVAPAIIPKKVVVVREPEPVPDVGGGIIGGIPGGVTGGVLGGIIGSTAAPSAPPPAAVAEREEREVLRVGGGVKPPRKLFAPAPTYPTLAQVSHVHGMVLIEAVIDEKGDVVNAHVLQGHPLLIQEALRTVMQWKYEPTYLNGVPYPIQVTVTVNFSFAS
jgi:protein TonB